MKKFRIKRDYNLFTEQEVFIIQMRFFFWWIDIKVFSDEDVEYARSCAYEVLYYLNREE